MMGMMGVGWMVVGAVRKPPLWVGRRARDRLLTERGVGVKGIGKVLLRERVRIKDSTLQKRITSRGDLAVAGMSRREN